MTREGLAPSLGRGRGFVTREGLAFFFLFPFFCKVSKWSQLTSGNSADITKSGVPEVINS